LWSASRATVDTAPTDEERRPMKRIALLAVVLTANQAAAAAGTTSGASALALSALVANQARSLSVTDRRVIARLFGGQTNFGYPANRTILVSADKIDCRVSNVDITDRSCELTFSTAKRTLKGRDANELYATLVEAGVASDGAAGTIHESVSHLLCTIDPNAIKQKDGSGADCKFDTGA
jgi:hypothetical protein